MYQDSTVGFPQQNHCLWTRSLDKRFEEALVVFPGDLTDRWQKIGEYLNMSASDVQQHYELLIHDVNEIDLGRVQLPCYADEESNNWDSAPTNQISFDIGGGGGCGGGKVSKKGEADRKKGTPWTEEEHRLFLLGLKQYGKGDWRSISRRVVISRTPTQVASHAQKYFLRQNSGKKDRKRSSIHDITTVPNGLVGQVDENSVPPLGAAPMQQPQAMQQMPSMSHLPNQGSALAYHHQSFGYHM